MFDPAPFPQRALEQREHFVTAQMKASIFVTSTVSAEFPGLESFLTGGQGDNSTWVERTEGISKPPSLIEKMDAALGTGLLIGQPGGRFESSNTLDKTVNDESTVQGEVA